MSTLRKAMNRREFIKRCVRGGATYENHTGDEYRLRFPDGQRYVGKGTKKQVGKVALKIAQANGIDID